jgi:N-acetylmuramoyl-L-alanine amidase
VIEPRSIRDVPGMGGRVFDFRGTGLLQNIRGPIVPRVMVHHIPVVENATGLADFRTLANILNGKTLGIQAATDEDGNVALFAPFDREVGGQLGANPLACGVEHMHKRINEDWTEKQMRAAAWCAHHVQVDHGIPLRRAILTSGDGFFDDDDPPVFHLTKNVGVQRSGHTSHKNVSAMIGSFQRSDPGPKFSFRHLYELAKFFQKHHRF